MSARVWLKHPKTNGYFECPAEVVDDWREMGWEQSDPPPPEPNPAVAEQLAWRAALAAEAEKSKPTKAARRGELKESES